MKLILFILIISCSLHSNAATLEVGKNKQYKTVKSAVLAAAPGDHIIIHEGTYAEGEISINKALIISGRKGAVLDGKNKYQVLHIETSRVIIEGLEIRNAGYSSTQDWAAIKVANATDIIIRNNRLVNTSFGIYLQNTLRTIVENNEVSGTAVNEILAGNAIHCWKSDNARITGNTVTGHRDGIYFEFVTNSVVQHNYSYKNVRYGLHFMFSNNDIYMYNTFRENGAGVAVMYSKEVKMIANTFDFNWGSAAYGILLKEINDGSIKYNRFINNTIAVHMEGTNRLHIQYNTFTSNGWAMRVQASSMANTIVDNNFFGNTFDMGTNGTVQLNEMSGNYWDKYEGYDRNKDGTGDIPYHPVSLYSMVVERMPTAAILLRSFMVKIMDKAERVIPSITPIDLEDDKPRMKPMKF